MKSIQELKESFDIDGYKAILKLMDRDNGDIHFCLTKQNEEEAKKSYEFHTMIKLKKYIKI